MTFVNNCPVFGVTLKYDSPLVFFLLMWTFSYFHHDPGWNGNSRLGLTFAIVQEGRLTIDSFHDAEETKTGDKSFRDGHFYSDKAIGASVLSALLYWPMYRITQWFDIDVKVGLVKYVLTLLVVGLPSAVAGTLMYRLGCLMAGSCKRAFLATMAVTLGTMWSPFSMIFFGHQLAASLLVGTFYILFLFRIRPGSRTPTRLFLAGILAGFAIMTEYTTVLIVLPLAVYYMLSASRELYSRPLTFLGLPMLGGAIPLALAAGYNTLCFGHPMSVGYSYLTDPAFGVPMSQGFMGIHWPSLRVLYYLTVHPAQGLFWQSPVLLLAFPGWYGLYRNRFYRAELGVAVFSTVAYLLINSGYFMWWGGDSFGPRHLVPMIPFLGLSLFLLPENYIRILMILGLVSAAHMLIASAGVIWITGDDFAFLDRMNYFEFSAIYHSCLTMLMNGRFVKNLGSELAGLGGWWSLVPLILFQAGITTFFFMRKEATHPTDK